MHCLRKKEILLCSWLRDEEGKEEKRKKADKETREVVSRSGKREGEKGERTKRLLLKEGVSTLFPVMLLRNSRGGLG